MRIEKEMSVIKVEKSLELITDFITTCIGCHQKLLLKSTPTNLELNTLLMTQKNHIKSYLLNS